MNYEEQIEEIMDWFDFGCVAKVMKVLEWEWHGYDGVPTEPEIRKYARGQLRYVVERNVRYSACGGFVARNEDGLLSLAFEVESWQVEPQEDLF